jgi:hypothetical protein
MKTVSETGIHRMRNNSVLLKHQLLLEVCSKLMLKTRVGVKDRKDKFPNLHFWINVVLSILIPINSKD